MVTIVVVVVTWGHGDDGGDMVTVAVRVGMGSGDNGDNGSGDMVGQW